MQVAGRLAVQMCRKSSAILIALPVSGWPKRLRMALFMAILCSFSSYAGTCLIFGSIYTVWVMEYECVSLASLAHAINL
jgi:hypothetical protein